MGCGNSRVHHSKCFLLFYCAAGINYCICLIGIKIKKSDAEKLALLGMSTDDLDMMASVFERFDVTGEGNLSLVEFLTDCSVQINLMTMRIFNCLDSKKNNKIEFFDVRNCYLCI